MLAPVPQHRKRHVCDLIVDARRDGTNSIRGSSVATAASSNDLLRGEDAEPALDRCIRKAKVNAHRAELLCHEMRT